MEIRYIEEDGLGRGTFIHSGMGSVDGRGFGNGSITSYRNSVCDGMTGAGSGFGHGIGDGCGNDDCTGGELYEYNI